MIFRNALFGLAFSLTAAAGAFGAWRWFSPSPKPATQPTQAAPAVSSDDEDEPPKADEVKTIRPRRDQALTVAVHQYATVQPYYQVDLRARASGVIKYIPKDRGSQVTKGELLVEIDVPDLRQEIAQKQAVVDQRRDELRVARAEVKTAEAFVEVAAAAIETAETKVAQAFSTRELRETRLHRFQSLLADRGTTPDVVDEARQGYQAADSEWQAAKVAVKTARATLHEKEASLEAAKADITLKESLIRVAEKDRDRVQALADYARVTAPFDGDIVNRDVDLGAFVQNATASATKPLLTLQRTDIVTVVARLPDNVAPFVSRDTRVLLQLNERPGVQLEGRVTRFTRSVLNEDRTMQVEVDLFNGGAARYGRFLGQYFACQLAAVGGSSPLETLALAAAGRDQLGPRLKSVTDPLPLQPLLRSGIGEPPRLLPGMSGQMTVYLQRFANVHLLPSGAVFSRGGKQYILLVRDGIIRLTPVKVQVDDGQLAKVTIVDRQANARTGETERLKELTGDEEVVASGQSAFSDGQAVHAVPEDP